MCEYKECQVRRQEFVTVYSAVYRQKGCSVVIGQYGGFTSLTQLMFGPKDFYVKLKCSLGWG